MTPLWIRTAVGLLGLGGLVLAAPTASAVDQTILHTPPASYRQAGPCSSNIGTPYQDSQQGDAAPTLFYHGGELIKILALFKEGDIRAGKNWNLLNEFGNLPITMMTFNFSQGNPMTRQPGAYYVLSLTIDRRQAIPSFTC
ncbi:MAG: hypothetical protein HY208_04510 [Nitrospirae bacterium]|nr:hypothetical protein [Nitrospirota bacterium]